MDFLKCKACGSVGMVPMDVRLLDADDETSETPEYRDYVDDSLSRNEDESEDTDGDENEDSRFYSCHVCGDNWLSIRRSEDGQSRVTFIHQMGVQPVLRRVAYLQTDIVVNEATVDYWEYFLDDDEVAEGEWMDKLSDRRKVLKAICTN